MTAPRWMLPTKRPTQGCRGCHGFGLGYHHEPCLLCPSEAERIYQEEQARKNYRREHPYTPEEAAAVIAQIREFARGFGRPVPTEEELWRHMTQQGYVRFYEEIFSVHTGNPDEMAILVEVFHADKLKEAATMAQGDSGAFNQIIRERLAQAVERQRMKAAKDVSSEGADHE